MPLARFLLLLALVVQPLWAQNPACTTNWAFINNPKRRVSVPPSATQKVPVAKDLDVKKELADVIARDQLKLMTLNAENLELFWTTDTRNGIKQKPLFKVLGQADIIIRENPDVIVMQEVADAQSLERFAGTFLAGRYQPIVFETNDGRGTHVAALVRRGLPLEFVVESHTKEPKADGSGRVHSRDAITVIARVPGTDTPLFAVIGTHAKSKRQYSDTAPGDDGSILRGEQAQAMAIHYADLKKNYPSLAVFVMADFNNEFVEAREYKVLRDLGMRDAIDVMNDRLPENQRLAVGDIRRVTETTFKPVERTTGADIEFMEGVRRSRAGDRDVVWKQIANQLDGALADPEAQKLVTQAKVVRWVQADGREFPLPKDKYERDGQPSDHMPYVVSISFTQAMTAAGMSVDAYRGNGHGPAFHAYVMPPVYAHDKTSHPFTLENLSNDGINFDQPNPLPRVDTGSAVVGLKNFGRWVGLEKSQNVDKTVLGADHLIILPKNGQPVQFEPAAGFTFANLRKDGEGFVVELRPLSGPANLYVLRFDAAGKFLGLVR